MDEFEIIRRYFVEPNKVKSPHLVVGPGDDSAVVRVPEGYDLCVSTDTLIDGVHFPVGIDAAVVVYRALGANLSDLAAMGAEPYGCTIALTLAEFSEGWLSEFSKQLHDVLALYQLPLFGGNLAKGQLSVTVNIMGLVPEGMSLLRSGAHPDDDVYVTGQLGDAAGGLEIIQNNLDVDHQDLLARYKKPVPRLKVGIALRSIASSAIDISDGFAADLHHLCQASGCGANISLEALPVSETLTSTFGVAKAQVMAIQGGDDYELCFTAPRRNAGRIEDLRSSTGTKITRVGKMRLSSGVDILKRDGSKVSYTSGYKHF